MKTIVTDTTLVDLLIVCKGLPADEIEQIEAFSGKKFDLEQIAIQLMTTGGPTWTCRIRETGEPLVVAGFIQVGRTIWRSFMLANQRAWDEYGVEVTAHVCRMLKRFLKNQEHIRIETICLATRKKAHEWYLRIGLTHEATLESYGVNGESAVLYVKTKGARKY
jgi:hypothetical protein